MTEEERIPDETPEQSPDSLWEQVLAEAGEEAAASEAAANEAADEPGAEEPEDAGEQADPALAEAQAKADEYLALAQRVQADFDNFRRRNASVRADAYADGQRAVAGSMLGVLDNLERALSSAGEDSPLRSGIELTLRQMWSVYEKLGVTVIDRLGEKFDPNLENAVMQGTPDEGEPGTVCQVLQKGYSMDGHVLRHAMVKVVADE
ncbi:MAG: nucleotide exchange factor GrpE [Clostridia bacterium]|nr:nucleotide exchange factor GrpE [Clostridia bacterium]